MVRSLRLPYLIEQLWCTKQNTANETSLYEVGIHTIAPADVNDCLNSLIVQRFPQRDEDRKKNTLIVMATGGCEAWRRPNSKSSMTQYGRT